MPISSGNPVHQSTVYDSRTIRVLIRLAIVVTTMNNASTSTTPLYFDRKNRVRPTGLVNTVATVPRWISCLTAAQAV